MATIVVLDEFIPGIIGSDQTIAYNTAPQPLTGGGHSGGMPPYSYQWQSSLDGLTFIDIAGATDLGYAPGLLTETTWYRQIQTSSNNCGSMPGNELIITVNPGPFIFVTSPGGGENWRQGSIHDLTWNDNLAEDVKIELFKEGLFQQTIVASTPSNGIFSWTIPVNQPAEGGYQIKISGIVDATVFDVSDNDFTISLLVPVNLDVHNITVFTGKSMCFSALETITVGGNGNTFLVQNGGSATMIAGRSIRFLPGTSVESGGYLHGYITATGEYCGMMAPSIPAVVSGETGNPLPADQFLFMVYPNPTDGKFTVEYAGAHEIDKINIEIFGMKGDRIQSKELVGTRRHEFSLEDRPTGIYLVRIVTDEVTKTVRVLKR